MRNSLLLPETAKLVEVDGRRLLFEVEAHDGMDLISRGKHERYIISKEKFDAKMREKKKWSEQLQREQGLR